METKVVIENLAKALINWYKFNLESKSLFVIGGIEECNVISEVLQERCGSTEVVSVEELDTVSDKFDYIVMAGAVEISKNPVEFLSKIKEILKTDGKLLIGTDNRFAIRYFCGDKDIFTGCVLDGIDNYRNVDYRISNVIRGRSYTKAELEGFLMDAGFKHFKFYSVMPVLWRPQMIMAYGYKPNEDLEVRIFPQYKNPQTLFLHEESLYKQLVANDMLHPMANGYLIECSLNGELTNANQITVQGDRSPEEALATVLQDDMVNKRALYYEGINKIVQLDDNSKYLEEHNVKMVPHKIEGDSFVMPYIKGQLATDYFRELLRTNPDEFVKEFETFKNIVENSSESIPYEEVNWRHFDPDWRKRREDDPNIDKFEKLSKGSDDDKADLGVILKRGYIDLVSLNCFHTEEGFVFFDQEFFQEEFPANAILIRTVDFIYRDNPDLELCYSRVKLMEKYHLTKHENIFRRWFNIFLYKLRNEGPLVSYHKTTRRENEMIKENRTRMNFSQEEYNRVFVDVFKNAANKKLYLFGSGNFTRKFLDAYGADYSIDGLLDNNSEKWGESIDDIPIIDPVSLMKLEHPFKVIVCVKQYKEIVNQLKGMGIKDIAVFNPKIDYEMPKVIHTEDTKSEPKPYHIGYVAGVFDMFHLGHLNLLRRAKEQCDYLIVGIESDEQVVRKKMTSPIMSFEERQQIVQACKYVDNAVMIPLDKYETEDAFRMYHFDVQFSGSDYADNVEWLSKQTYLREHGSDMVFFPYTESVSTTKLKSKLKEGK